MYLCVIVLMVFLFSIDRCSDLLFVHFGHPYICQYGKWSSLSSYCDRSLQLSVSSLAYNNKLLNRTQSLFNLQLWNIEIILLMWLSKKSSVFLIAELLPLFYFSLRFFCKFEEQLKETQRIKKSNCQKLIIQRQQFQWRYVRPKQGDAQGRIMSTEVVKYVTKNNFMFDTVIVKDNDAHTHCYH